MQTFVTFPHEHDEPLPDGFEGDVRTPAAYVRHFLTEYSEPGDVVLDPFAGFGTTLAVAEELGREPWGIEYEADRAAAIRERIESGENVVEGSALELETHDLPAFDCCLTSPPYMVEQMAADPLVNYAGEGDYGSYLADLESVFGRLRGLAAPDASVLVDISNMKHEGNVTTLAWDAADAVAESFHFEGEVVIGWESDENDAEDGEDGENDAADNYGYGYDHSYCLVFTA